MKKAAEAGDVAAMVALAAKNPRLLVEQVESDGWTAGYTALHRTARNGHATGA